jgi:response regulator RpfG family c-di-GMP phosphodiesterase
MSTFHINLHQAIYSLSDALDLVGVTHIHHGKRVAYMAAECGRHLGWTGKRLDDLFVAAMLHDCGVSKTIIHSRLAQLEWENEKDHCEIGAGLLRNCPPLARLADPVRFHHTHWSALKDLNLPLEIKLAANCIYMVDRVDILTLSTLKDQSNILLGRDATRQTILERRGDWFCEELVDAIMQVPQRAGGLYPDSTAQRSAAAGPTQSGFDEETLQVLREFTAQLKRPIESTIVYETMRDAMDTVAYLEKNAAR